MAWRIVKQPNGLLARFSDIVDDFTHTDMTYEEALALCLPLGHESAVRKVQAGVDDLRPWTNERGSGTERWAHCMEIIRALNSNDFDDGGTQDV